MTQEDRLQRLLNIDDPINEQEQKEFNELFNSIVKDLKDFEELKQPYDEYETEDYLLTREAYYNDNLGKLCYGYTVYKWDGTYEEIKIPILNETMKNKNWKEESHAGCVDSKIDLKEYLENHIKSKKNNRKESQ